MPAMLLDYYPFPYFLCVPCDGGKQSSKDMKIKKPNAATQTNPEACCFRLPPKYEILELPKHLIEHNCNDVLDSNVYFSLFLCIFF